MYDCRQYIHGTGQQCFYQQKIISVKPLAHACMQSCEKHAQNEMCDVIEAAVGSGHPLATATLFDI